ncbi:MAG: DUF929 family protein [Candidatus Micrarchaeota archaeon]|nr:DUF929 family protein [Candidatus Micrarchaeota archaeon]
MARMKQIIQRLEVIIALLVVVVAALAVYIAYPSIKLYTQGQPFGKRLTGINSPLNSQQLSVINSAPDSNYEIAGEKLLNLSIPGEQGQNNTYVGPLFQVSLNRPPQYNSLVIDGKPSVVYIGAISCIYCAENRWAMALALSRFGSFGNLYVGYSSMGDGDVPTLYWYPQNYTSNASVIYGNDYHSNYINFFSAEYDSPISAGFEFPTLQDPISYFVEGASNQSYKAAMQFMDAKHIFQGTPYTFWGTSANIGADAVVFGNGTSQSAISNYPPLTYMTHSQILGLLKQANSTFAYEEYAAADVYIAETCPSINNSAPICSLPAIAAMERRMGLA